MKKNYFLITIFIISLLSLGFLFLDILDTAVVAWLLVMITRSFAKYLEGFLLKSKFNFISSNVEFLSAIILTSFLLCVVFMPLIFLAGYAINNFNYSKIYPSIINLKSNFIEYVNTLTWLSDSIKSKFISIVNSYSNDFASGEKLKQAWFIIQRYITNISQIILDGGIIIAMFFLFHWYYKEITQFVSKLIPVEINTQTQIYKNVGGIIGQVFYSTLAVAISQGFALGVLMAILGHNALMIGLLTATASIIPVFGSALVWVPMAIIEVIHGNIFNAVIICVFGSFVLAFLIDNFARIFFLSRISRYIRIDNKINEFLLFFAIASGISVFGFWGILIGPAIVALFITLANVISK